MRLVSIIWPIIFTAVSAAAGTLTGTWKLDPARSRMDPPIRLVWAPAGTGYKYTSPSVSGVAWPVDGTPIPSPTEQDILVSRKRINSRVIEEYRTRGGTQLSVVVRTVSPDGKRLTVAGKGVNAANDKFDYATPYKRVGAPAQDPFAGTWEEDFFGQAREPILIVLEESASRFRVAGKGYEWTAPFDGRQTAVKLSWADHAHIEHPGEGQVRAQLTKAGRVTREEEYTLSKDGNTLTVRRRLPGAKPPRGFHEVYSRTR